MKLDLRDIAQLPGPFDGIWASGCLYHLAKAEFSRCVDDCRQLLSQRGILYLSMKQGRGERYRSVPGPHYPGGPKARKLLRGRRFYSYYQRDELLGLLRGFDLLKIQDLQSGEAGFALWMRRSSENRAEAAS